MNVCRFLGVEMVGQGQCVYEEGDPVDKYYIMMIGKVDFYTDKKRIGSARPGDGLGKAALLSHKSRHEETAVAKQVRCSRLSALFEIGAQLCRSTVCVLSAS